MAKRIDLLDAWRSLCVLLMVIYHLIYDLALFNILEWDISSSDFGRPLAIAVSGSFIVIAGISSRLSRNNLRRGLIVLAAAIAVSIGARIAGDVIRFGVLHMLGISMVIYGFAWKQFEKVPERAAPVLWAALAAASALLTAYIVPERDWLFALGFKSEAFYSADYVPLLPWFFIYLFGTWAGGVIVKRRSSGNAGPELPKTVTWPGRHSLVIYLLHQPVLFGLCALLSGMGA